MSIDKSISVIAHKKSKSDRKSIFKQEILKDHQMGYNNVGQKTWIKKLLSELDITSDLFQNYGIYKSVYNIIVDYIVCFPRTKITEQDLKNLYHKFKCFHCLNECSKLVLKYRPYFIFSTYHKGKSYFHVICSNCVYKYTGNFIELRINKRKDHIVREESKYLLIWLGLIDFGKVIIQR